MKPKAYLLTETRYGFAWGPAKVDRTCSDQKWGVIVSVKGKREVAEVRVTPSGLVRFTKRKATDYDRKSD